MHLNVILAKIHSRTVKEQSLTELVAGCPRFEQGLLVVYSSALNIYIILFILHVGLFLLSFSVCEAHKRLQLKVCLFARIT